RKKCFHIKQESIIVLKSGRSARPRCSSSEMARGTFMKENPYGAHNHRHAFASFNALEREGLAVVSRRNMLKAGLAGMAGLSLPSLLRNRALASKTGQPVKS